MCVAHVVCERERETEGQKQRETDRQTDKEKMEGFMLP